MVNKSTVQLLFHTRKLEVIRYMKKQKKKKKKKKKKKFNSDVKFSILARRHSDWMYRRSNVINVTSDLCQFIAIEKCISMWWIIDRLNFAAWFMQILYIWYWQRYVRIYPKDERRQQARNSTTSRRREFQPAPLPSLITVTNQQQPGPSSSTKSSTSERGIVYD